MANVWTQNKKKTTPAPAPNPLDPINVDLYRTHTSTIKDISNKYGIDYSREYAARQAEAAAQAKRAGLQNQQKQVEVGVKNANDQLSRTYFQRGLESAQAGVNNGMNAGLQNEANIRLGMNRQGEVAGIQREAQVQRNSIAQQLTDVEVARRAQEEQIYNERLQAALQQVNAENSLDQGERQRLLAAALQQRQQAIDMDQFAKQMDWQKYQYANLSASDIAQNQLAYAQLNEQKRQFNSDAEWRQYTYANMSAADKARLDQAAAQFGEEMAWRQYEMEYMAKQQLAQIMAANGLSPGGYDGAGTPGPAPYNPSAPVAYPYGGYNPNTNPAIIYPYGGK